MLTGTYVVDQKIIAIKNLIDHENINWPCTKLLVEFPHSLDTFKWLYIWERQHSKRWSSPWCLEVWVHTNKCQHLSSTALHLISSLLRLLLLLFFLLWVLKMATLYLSEVWGRGFCLVLETSQQQIKSLNRSYLVCKSVFYYCLFFYHPPLQCYLLQNRCPEYLSRRS